MIFFISDLHFGHKNCLSYDNRPFASIEENDNTIIKNWNNTVNIDDDVYILGDISWYNSTKTIEIFKKLNGSLHLIIGNHDNKFLKNINFRNLFVEICNYKELYMNNEYSIVLCHYPIVCFKNYHRGWYHLYGHVHNTIEWNVILHSIDELQNLHNKPCKAYNVGCMMDYINYTPRTLEEIIGENK